MIDEQPSDDVRIARPFESEAARNLVPHLNARSLEEALPSPNEALRRFAQASDAQQSDPFNVSILWHGLCDGIWKFVDTFSSQTRCYAILREQRVPRPPEPRLLTMLALTMSGHSRKVLAFDLNLSLSTISGGVQGCLRSMGLECRHAPALLIMAASSAQQQRSAASAWRFSRLQLGADQYLVVSAHRPDLAFPSPLSEAEASVVRDLVGGLSYAAIAEKRSKSVRTIANQIAAAFRKLGVSGRQALMERLIAYDQSLDSANVEASNDGPSNARHRARTSFRPKAKAAPTPAHRAFASRSWAAPSMNQPPLAEP
jgi:DNA-binding NarL/FixJ family response regulator